MCHSPKFEPNQNGHNSVNFEARTSRFCMVVALEEEDEDRLRRTTTTRTTTITTNITPEEQLALLSRASSVQF